PNSSPFSRFWPLNIFFSKNFFSLFLKDLDELSSNRVTTMAQFLTVFEILAFEYFFFKKFFFVFFKDFYNLCSIRFINMTQFLTFFDIFFFYYNFFLVFFEVFE